MFGLVQTRANQTGAGGPHRGGRFKVFREMQGVRGFRLVLCADVHDCIAECATWGLEHAVATEAGGRLGHLRQEPSVITEMRSIRGRISDDAVGVQAKWPIRASAL